MVPTILKLNHWKSEQNGSFFVWIPNGSVLEWSTFCADFQWLLGKMDSILFKMEHHWKTEQKATYYLNSECVRYSSPHCSLDFECWKVVWMVKCLVFYSYKSIHHRPW